MMKNQVDIVDTVDHNKSMVANDQSLDAIISPGVDGGVEVSRYDSSRTCIDNDVAISHMSKQNSQKILASSNHHHSSSMDDSRYMIKDEKKTEEDDIPPVMMSLSDSELDRIRTPTGVSPSTISPRQKRVGTALKVLFLSSDTGGGHRASAESLGKQFQLLFPGSTYDLLDVVEKDGVPPYNSLVSAYKHLSNRPSQWKLVYNVSNTKAFEVLANAHLKLMCEMAVRRRIRSYNPDVVVSVHPLMTNVPVLACSNISNETGRNLPIFTVVTDLGSAHCLWFANGVEKMFVGSEAVKELAINRGKVPEEKIVMAGLPIRHDFAMQAELLGDRFSKEGKDHQRRIRRQLNLPAVDSITKSSDSSDTESNVDRPTLLVMGGGEGVGSLENITDALYVELRGQGIDALVLVVCGRNEKLQSWINKREWHIVYNKWRKASLQEEMREKGFISTLSVTDACVNVPSFTSLSLGNGCIEQYSTDRIRSIMKYTTGAASLGSFVSVPAKTTESDIDNETSANCGTDQILTTAGEVLAQLQYGDINDEPKINEVDVSEAAHRVNQLVVDSERGITQNADSESERREGQVSVVGLGFVNQMAEYMVAADILITKAGPGTISEAAALSLPLMLTSFLPGQEEGNVDFVVDNNFGAFCSVADPIGIAKHVCSWLRDEEKMKEMSRNAKAKGTPYAARDIAKSIGESTLRWLEHNQQQDESRKIRSKEVQ